MSIGPSGVKSILWFGLLISGLLSAAELVVIPPYDNGDEDIEGEFASTVSGDGRVVGLGVNTLGLFPTTDHPAYYTSASGTVILNNDPSYTGEFYTAVRVSGVSTNGHYLVGRVRAGNSSARLAAMWEGEGYSTYRTLFPPADDSYSAAIGVTENGSLVCGFEGNYRTQRVWRWDRVTDGVTFLDLPEGFQSSASASHPLSESGDVIAGSVFAYEPEEGERILQRACFWTSNAVVLLPLPDGMSNSLADYVTQDGEWIVGQASEELSDGLGVGICWNVASGEFRTLDPSEGFQSSTLTCITRDGRFGFGDDWQGVGGPRLGFFFDLETNRRYSVQEFFARHGVASSLDLSSFLATDLTQTDSSTAICGYYSLGSDKIASLVFVTRGEFFPSLELSMQYLRTDEGGNEHYEVVGNTTETDFRFERSHDLKTWSMIDPNTRVMNGERLEVAFGADGEMPNFYRVSSVLD